MGAFGLQTQMPSATSVRLKREGTETRARCTVGLLTWNAGGDGEACVKSLFAQTEKALDLVWIDNASTDGTPERLRTRFPQLPSPTINPQNMGFCAGHNQGLAACATPYFLALNQDAVLAPDYIERLCDWMDHSPRLAMASGLILMDGAEKEQRVWSAGLVFPRNRFAFSLGMGGPVKKRWQRRRFVPGVDGCAMMLRVAACRAVSLPPGDVFPQSFFAYCEEVDLALRLARGGWRCGVEGEALAWHRARGSGGFAKAAIRARFFANHWLATLRNESWGAIARDLPWIVRGELAYWLREYLQHPRAFLMALGLAAKQAGAARAFYHAFERAHGPSTRALERFKRFALAELRRSRPEI